MSRSHAVKPYLQLVRLPNLFTAAADSLAGWLLVTGSLAGPQTWLPLVAASVATYAGGIVLNDLFDLEIDRVERPNRPLPSGRVGRTFAIRLGVGLMVLGMACAIGSGTPHGWAIEAVLIACVLGYDAGLKRTPIGPTFMGACRGLNLLLGMSHAADLGGPNAWQLSLYYGLFVAGITWVSRSEVGVGPWWSIIQGMVLENLGVLGFLITAAAPRHFHDGGQQGPWVMPGWLVLAAIFLVVNRATWRAYRSGEPKWVQSAVKTAIFSLVWLHAGLLLAVWGPIPALSVAWLWFPALWAGRWIYAT